MEALAFIGLVVLAALLFRISGIESVEWRGFRIIASEKPVLSSKAKRRSLFR